jgi:hypothetical protein
MKFMKRGSKEHANDEDENKEEENEGRIEGDIVK